MDKKQYMNLRALCEVGCADCRERAVKELAKYTEYNLITFFTRRFEQEDNPQVKVVLLDALTEQEGGDNLGELFLKATEDHNLQVCEAAIEALAQSDKINGSSSDRLLLKEQSTRRKESINSLVEQSEILTKKIQDSRKAVRMATIRTLIYMQKQVFTQGLLEACVNDDDRIQSAARELLADESVNTLLLASESDVPSLRAYAIRLLTKYSGEKVDKAILKALKDDDREVLLKAIGAVGQRPDIEFDEGLVSILRRQTGYVCQKAKKVLSNRPNENLLSVMDDKYDWIRAIIIRALGDRNDNDDEIDTVIINSLEEMYFDALDALKKRPASRLLRALDDENSEIRMAVVEAMAEHNSEKITEALLRATEDEDKYVRYAAIGSLATRNGKDVDEALLRVTEDKNFWVRKTAAEIIKKRRRVAREHLLNLLLNRSLQLSEGP